jgi:hypothetical protein
MSIAWLIGLAAFVDWNNRDLTFRACVAYAYGILPFVLAGVVGAVMAWRKR